MTQEVSPAFLAGQIAYYRARADEYDQWWLRQGRYDRGAAATRAWRDEADEVRAVLAGMPLDGAEVLELAPGTGIWTQQLAARAARVTAVDAAPEMIAHNRAKLGTLAERVTYVRADLFAWQPTELVDAVVFCFWISHVPRERLDRFLATVAAALRPGGQVFFLDGRPEPRAIARGDALPGDGGQIMRRRLASGRTFEIVKNFWRPAELVAACEAAGLAVTVSETATYFQYGIGSRFAG